MLTSQSTSSRISQLEVRRAVVRLAPTKLMEANQELKKFSFCPLSNSILTIAESFSTKVTLRALDAIHVASVLSLEGAVEGLITYDKQMINNAKLLGIKVISPGMK